MSETPASEPTPEPAPVVTEPPAEMHEAGPVTEPVAADETTVTEVPPPQDFTATPQESLAEQVQRQSREMPDSQSPTDIVPNRPMIRPPQVQAEAEAAEAMQQPQSEPAPEGTTLVNESGEPLTTTEPVATETPVVTTPTTEPTNP